jgi:tetraprenyl-beta-curcumene synthase
VRKSIPVVRVKHKSGFCLAADFVCTARRYWLSVFPRVAREVWRRRALASRIPDPVLRRHALEALEHKRGNLDGAAVFATLVTGARRTPVIQALVAAQAICDYLDVLAEQPTLDPIANGEHLHRALIVATTPGEKHCDYYCYHDRSDDGGYLQALVESVREALTGLPLLSLIAEPMRRAAERISAYQAYNHGDTSGSYELFERWAVAETRSTTGLYWWETGAGAGSTLTLFVLIAAAADPGLTPSDVQMIEHAYFPWIGALHSLLDSLVDHDEDLAAGERGLIDCYPSHVEAATRMHMIAAEAMRRAGELPDGRRHELIVAAMTSFYICEIRRSTGPLAQFVAPLVLEAFGGLAIPTMAVLRMRRTLMRGRQPASKIGISSSPPSLCDLESQVPDFPLFIAPPDSEHTLVTSPMPIRSRAPLGG